MLQLTWLGAPGVVREGRAAGRVLDVASGCTFLGDGDAGREGRDGDELQEEQEFVRHNRVQSFGAEASREGNLKVVLSREEVHQCTTLIYVCMRERQARGPRCVAPSGRNTCHRDGYEGRPRLVRIFADGAGAHHLREPRCSGLLQTRGRELDAVSWGPGIGLENILWDPIDRIQFV